MATHDYVLDNATGANFRTDLNNALAAIVSNNSSSSEPATKYAYQWWADTNDGVLKIRNSANDGWVTLLQLDGTLTLEDGTNSAPALGFRDDLNTGIFSSAADTLDITCGGTTRGSFSSTGLAVTGNVSATTFVGNIDAVDGDFDGTLEADAITVAGVALSTVIAGTTVTTATNANHVSVADNESTNENNLIPFIEDASATGNVGLESDGDFTYNPSTGTVTATVFVGALTGNVTGNASGSSGSCTGNAATATALETARTIGGVSFDGTANINLAGVNTAGNQDTSGTAAIATTVTVADESSDTTCFPLFATAATGNLAPKSGSNLAFNSANGTLTATAFSGDGSALTGISAGGTTINNNANNRIITGSDTADTLEAESAFTFGSDVVQISSTTQGLGASFVNTGNEYTQLKFSANRTSANNALGIINAKWNNNHTVASIYLQAGSDTTNKDDGQIQFFTAASGGSGQSRLTIKNDGDIDITDGNLIVASGHGIDFSATGGPDAGSGSSDTEVLDDYERGQFAAAIVQGLGSLDSTFDNSATYEKVGNLVHIQALIQFRGTGNGTAVFLRLPFTHVTDTSLGGGLISFVNVSGLSGESTLSLIGQSGQSYAKVVNKSSNPSISGFQNNQAIYYHFTYHTS